MFVYIVRANDFSVVIKYLLIAWNFCFIFTGHFTFSWGFIIINHTVEWYSNTHIPKITVGDAKLFKFLLSKFSRLIFLRKNFNFVISSKQAISFYWSLKRLKQWFMKKNSPNIFLPFYSRLHTNTSLVVN